MSDHARLALCDVSGPLQDLLQKLEGDQATIWANGLKRFLRKENPWESNLNFNQNVDLPARPESFTPAEHFQTRDGLYVWSDFENLVLSTTKEVKGAPALNVSSFDLVKDTADDNIRAELPEHHVFADASAFCAHLAGMIQRQTGDEDRQKVATDGPMLPNGYTNIFYVNVGDRVVAVNARWGAGLREWSVNAYELDDDTWPAGHRVFSATAVA